MTGLLGLLGLGVRSRSIIAGVDAARRGLQSGDVHCVVMASDASDRAQDKVGRLARGKAVPVIVGPAAAELGSRLGLPPVMVVGVRDRALAEGILRLGGAPRSMEV